MYKTRSLLLVVVLLLSVAPVVMAANTALQMTGDPDSFFEAPDNSSFDGDLANFTVEAWVKPTRTDGTHIIVNKEDAYEIAVQSGTFQVALQPAGNSWAWIDSGAKVPADAWSHVAITFDGKTIAMFVNGKKVATNTDWQGHVNDSTDTFKVGRRTRGGASHNVYYGLIDEVRVSSVIRYTGDFTPPDAPFTADGDTTALYHFTDTKDASSRHNDGNLVKDAKLVAAEGLF